MRPYTVTQRAETQQNMRAAIELMTKDISLAGAGLPSGGLQLVTGGTTSLFGCNQTGTCYVPGGTYPNSGAGTPNYMYGLHSWLWQRSSEQHCDPSCSWSDQQQRYQHLL